MANQTIYPYGTGGQLPSSIGIINDLTTGGADKALSAEMGVELAEELADVEGRVSEMEASGAFEGMIAVYDGVDTLLIGNSADLAYIKVSRSSMNFRDTATGSSNTKTFRVKGRNLTNGITLALSGTNAAMFALSSYSIGAADANNETTITVTYSPSAVGSHTASVVIASGTITRSVALSATGVETVVPEIIINGGDDITISAAEGDIVTKTVGIVGVNLLDDVSIAVTGTGLSVSPSSLSIDENGAVDGEVTISYEAGSNDVSGALTATSGQNVFTQDIDCTVVQRQAEGSVFVVGKLKYTVLSNNKNVNVQMKDKYISGAVEIPDTILDSNGASYNVVRLASAAFNGATSITSVKIGNKVTGADSTHTFNGCTALTSIDFGTKISSFGNYAFNGCSALTNLVFPTNVTSLGGNNQNMTRLTLIDFSANMSSLPWAGFYTGNSALATIVIRYTGGVYAINNCFQDTNALQTIYVPDALVNNYKSSWSAFAGKIQPLSLYES